MALREDLSQALAVMSRAKDTQLALDENGWGQIPVVMPDTLVKLSNGQLIVEVVLSKTAKYFTLLTPLAVLKEQPSAAFYEALFYRQFYADQVNGAGFGVSAGGNNDRLVALYHWPLAAITPEQFGGLFQNFVMAALGLINELSEMSRQEPAVVLVHPAGD
jgi:hypothetical protein